MLCRFLEIVIRATMNIVDEERIGKFTLSGTAKKLCVGSSSLYKHEERGDILV